jgi:hypothetical protein
MKKIFYLSIVLIFLFSAEESFSQMNRKAIKKNNRRISSYKGRKTNFGKDRTYTAVGISLNALNYYGDLAPKPSKLSTDITFTRPALGLSLSHRFGPRYTLTAGFMYGTLRGSDVESADKDDAQNGMFRYNRNLSFRNKIKEFSLVGTFDLFENQSTYISRVRWTPYIFAGVAVFHHNPQALIPGTGVNGQPLPEGGTWADLQPLGTEGQHANLLETDANYGIKPYKLIQLAIPFGLGVRFRINEVMDFSAELGYRHLFTDYIDDVSGSYVDLGVFGDDETAKALSYRSHDLAEFAPSSTNTRLTSYIGRDGQQYFVIPGYGQEFTAANGSTNVRGNSKDKDIYVTTTFRLTYILGKTFHRAKFR